MSELAFIEQLRKLATHPGARNFSDDCAVVELGGEVLVLTHDTMAQDVHYLTGQDPTDVAWKLVSVNISDLAAKGAEPVGVLLGYMLGEDDERFLAGLDEALRHYDVPLLGGDTIVADGPQVLGLTAIGRATYCPVPSRSGAKPSDGLFITGPVGAAMMGFEALKAGASDTAAFRRPYARLAEGRALAPHVTAMMDISDGLLLDATRMADASNVTFKIDRAKVPIAAPESRRDDALCWGDDYELLFTAPADAVLPEPAIQIGLVAARSTSPVLLDGHPPSPEMRLGFEH